MNEQYSVAGKVAVITGAAGALGGSLARHFAAQGADVVALVHRPEQVEPTVASLPALGGKPCGYACNVMDTVAVSKIADEVIAKYGKVDILINVAGGNVAGANVMPDQNFWDMKLEDWTKVLDLNLNGTVYPCHVFTKVFAKQGYGCILNISSMAAYDALSRVAGYGAAKEGVSNFTRWLAAEMAIKYGEKIRVNALAPGFFIGKQNRELEEDIELATMQTNALGFTRMIGEAYRYFAEQGRGHIAAITSIAGTKGLGPAPSYSATKAMQNVYLQALEQQANSRGLKIRFTDIRPGFVDTALLDGDFRYPMMLKPESVARDILSAIHHHRHIQVIDWKYRLLTCLWRRIPRCLWRHLRI